MKEKTNTTNYRNTFIEAAEDFKEDSARVPMPRGNNKTVAEMQFELIAENPYKYTSDDVLFQVFAVRNGVEKAAMEEAREDFFSKGQPCFRASPLTKTHGFGVHANQDSKIAIYPLESDAYKAFVSDDSVKKVKAMRTSRK